MLRGPRGSLRIHIGCSVATWTYLFVSGPCAGPDGARVWEARVWGSGEGVKGDGVGSVEAVPNGPARCLVVLLRGGDWCDKGK